VPLKCGLQSPRAYRITLWDAVSISGKIDSMHECHGLRSWNEGGMTYEGAYLNFQCC